MTRRRLIGRAVWEGLQLASLVYAWCIVLRHLTGRGPR